VRGLIPTQPRQEAGVPGPRRHTGRGDRLRRAVAAMGSSLALCPEGVGKAGPPQLRPQAARHSRKSTRRTDTDCLAVPQAGSGGGRGWRCAGAVKPLLSVPNQLIRPNPPPLPLLSAFPPPGLPWPLMRQNPHNTGPPQARHVGLPSRIRGQCNEGACGGLGRNRIDFETRLGSPTLAAPPSTTTPTTIGDGVPSSGGPSYACTP